MKKRDHSLEDGNDPSDPEQLGADRCSESDKSDTGGSSVKPEAVTLSKEEYDVLLKKLADLEGLKDQLLRKAADFDNAKKRLEKDKEDYYKFATERLIQELLPVLDNLNRAIEQAEKASPNDAILKGIHLIEKHVFDILKKYGLTRIEALDQPFSTQFHDAIGEVETKDKAEGTVVEEFETGYLLHGKVLRPSRVKIAKAHSTLGPGSAQASSGQAPQTPEESSQ